MDDLLSKFSSLTGLPERFLEVQDDAAESFKESTKALYDLGRSKGVEESDGALPELIVENFDDEQVWQELELQNEPAMQEMLQVVSKLSALQQFSFHTVEPRKKVTKKSEQHDSESENEDSVSDDELNESEDHFDERKGFENIIGSDDSEEEHELQALLEKVQSMPHETEDDSDIDDTDFDFDTDLKFKKSKDIEKIEMKNEPIKSKKKSIVDDKFFRLDEMTAFLEQEDAREARKQKLQGKAGQEEQDSSDEEADMDDEDDDESVANVKYSDFFDPPSGESTKKTVAFGETEEQEGLEDEDGDDRDYDGDSDDVDSDDGNSDGDEDEEEDAEMHSEDEDLGEAKKRDLFEDSDEGENIAEILGGDKSSFEQRQARLKKKVAELEETSLVQKPWQLKGEITAADRPENSLLQEDLDFDATTKTAPVITEETTKSLEDIIKQRIKDKAWDDVERKNKPTEDVFEYKKKVVLEQEKSKMSLSQVYEQEFLKQQQEEEEEKEEPKHEEIRKSLQSLFVKLDALSNFHYTPRAAAPEVKIVSNLPSIAMEEALPVAASDATTLAPEEIKGKKKEELKGDTEKTKTDKKRARRKKKQRQAAHYEAAEKKAKKLAKTNPNSQASKTKALKDVQKLSKTSSGVTLMKETQKRTLTSSSQFFSQLQDQVTSHIAAKKSKQASSKADRKSSSKLKL